MTTMEIARTTEQKTKQTTEYFSKARTIASGALHFVVERFQISDEPMAQVTETPNFVTTHNESGLTPLEQYEWFFHHEEPHTD